MATTIKVLRKDLIAKLSSIKEDNVSIADVVISRQKLLATLRLQTEDVLTVNYGKVSWQEKYQTQGYASYWRESNVENEPCIQFGCNHTIMRFLNRPKTNWGTEPKVIPLNFVDHRDNNKVELTGIPLDTQELIRALSFVLPCVATETGRPVLNCILFDSGDDAIKLVSADGFRLGVSKVIAEGIHAEKVVIDIMDIKRLLTFLKAVKPIGKGKGKVYPEVYLHYDYKAIKFSTEHGSIELDKQTYTFPDYERLIPKDGSKIELTSNNMLEAVKAVSHIANDGAGIIRLQFNTGEPCGKIKVFARSEELGESQAECDALVESEGKIAVNARYLIDLLRLCPDTKITMRTTNPSNPMLFDIDANRQCLLMPMFVQW